MLILLRICCRDVGFLNQIQIRGEVFGFTMRCSCSSCCCCCCCPDLTVIQSCLRDYDRIQSLAVIFIFIQIGCALIGALGAMYSGISLINLGIGLFALVAIESSSQSLARTYAVLLCSAVLLDICWFILFTHEIWNISSEIYGKLVIFSVKLTLAMQIVGFSVRVSSSLLWIQMYRLGVSHLDCTYPREADNDMRNSFINPSTPVIVRQPSGSDDVLGGSIYDPAHYSSLFQDSQKDGYSFGSDNHMCGEGGSLPDAGTSLLKPTVSKSFQTIHDKNAITKLQSV